MTFRILGAGFGRTGTLSLKYALEALGFAPCHHMVEIESRPAGAAPWLAAARGAAMDWQALLAPYSAAVDWPAAAFWREILAAHPHARVVLTVRDSASWYASFLETIVAMVDGPAPRRSLRVRAIYDLSREVVLNRTFYNRAADPAHAIGVFEQHNRDVIAAIEAERLLVYDVARGWEPLCCFLGRAVPAIPFPHLNTRAAFGRRYASTTDALSGAGASVSRFSR